MTRFAIILFTTFFMLIALRSKGQTIENWKPEKMDISKIAGKYTDGRFDLIIKKNKSFKTRMAAPRPLVEKGIWAVHNDTLICYLTQRNTNINNEGKRIKGRPIAYKLIMVNGKLYSVVDEKIIVLPKNE